MSETVYQVDDVVVTAQRRPLPHLPGFSLNNFKSEIQTKGILQTARHLMLFTLPRGLLGAYDPNDVRQCALRCEASSLPGVSFATSEEIRRYGIGPGERRPYLPVFGPVTTSYIVDGEGVIHSFFYDWMSFIAGFDSSKGMLSQNAFGNLPYELSYKDDYKSQATIVVYNEKENKVIEITLNSAYPIAIEAVPVAWASEEFVRLNVTWEYLDWNAKYYAVPSGADSVGGLEAIRRNINKLAGPDGPLGRISAITGALGVNNPVASLIGRIGSASQRMTDIGNLVSGTKKIITDSIAKRFGF